jgi:hypothetical protein
LLPTFVKFLALPHKWKRPLNLKKAKIMPTLGKLPQLFNKVIKIRDLKNHGRAR